MTWRYFFGPNIDEPIIADPGASFDCGNLRFLNLNQQGSMIAAADCAGNRTTVARYDEYGIPADTNWGRFGYTGQAWVPEVKLWYYKARFYSPHVGRFMQTDPIGYENSPNLYAYVGNNPINLIDPSGAAWATGRMPGAQPSNSQVATTYIDNHPVFKHLDGIDRANAIERVRDYLFGELSLLGTAVSLSSLTGGEASQGWGTQLGDANLYLAGLNFLERQIASGVYSNNPQIRENIRNVVENITGANFSNAQIDRVMRDILLGESTSIGGLRELGQIRATNFSPTPTQLNILNIYISELPSGPLNNQIKRGWQRWKRGGR